MTILWPDDVWQRIQDGSDQAFNDLLHDATQQFDVPYYECRPWSIRALALVAATQDRKDRALPILRNGLQTALYRGGDVARRRIDTDANAIGVGSAAVALGRLASPDMEDEFVDALKRAPDEHYEIEQTAGYLASALSMLKSSAAAEFLEDHLRLNDAEMKDENEARMRYAIWTIRDDRQGALEFLTGTHDTDDYTDYDGDFGNRHFAVAALADMGATDCTDTIAAARDKSSSELLGPTIDEALKRLKEAKVRPVGDRLIWHLGVSNLNEPSDEFDVHWEKPLAMLS